MYANRPNNRAGIQQISHASSFHLACGKNPLIWVQPVSVVFVSVCLCVFAYGCVHMCLSTCQLKVQPCDTVLDTLENGTEDIIPTFTELIRSCRVN